MQTDYFNEEREESKCDTEREDDDDAERTRGRFKQKRSVHSSYSFMLSQKHKIVIDCSKVL